MSLSVYSEMCVQRYGWKKCKMLVGGNSSDGWCLLKRVNKQGFCAVEQVLPVTVMSERLQACILPYNNLIYQGTILHNI